MSKNNILGITGLTGVGKDYLVNAANPNKTVNTLNLGTLVGEALAMDRDAMMTTASPERIRHAQISAYRHVVKVQPVIVTCHAVRDAVQGTGYAYDREMEDIFNPTAYVFVSAPPELIEERVARRNESGERKSIVLSAKQIEDEQAAKLSLMGQLASEIECDLVVLQNVNELFEDNVVLLREQIARIQTPQVNLAGGVQ
jgi:adenylate kinase